MSWVAAGIASATAIAGLLNAQEQRSQQKRKAVADSIGMQMSPWTHQQFNPSAITAPTGAMGAVQGGLAGAMMGSQFNKAAPAAPPTTPTPLSPQAQVASNAAQSPAFAADTDPQQQGLASYLAKKPTFYSGN